MAQVPANTQDKFHLRYEALVHEGTLHGEALRSKLAELDEEAVRSKLAELSELATEPRC